MCRTIEIGCRILGEAEELRSDPEVGAVAACSETGRHAALPEALPHAFELFLGALEGWEAPPAPPAKDHSWVKPEF